MIKGKAFSPKAKHGTKGKGNSGTFLYADMGCAPVNRAERRRQEKKLKRKNGRGQAGITWGEGRK